MCDVGISLVRSGRFPKEVIPEVISNRRAEICSVGREKGSVFLFEDRSRWPLQLKYKSESSFPFPFCSSESSMDWMTSICVVEGDLTSGVY